jgi:hypothetical protein
MQGTHDESGANAVEFALVLPILVMLLFGTMYGASMYNSQQTITQSAREGARFGAILPLSEFGDVAGPPEDAWFDEVAARAGRVLADDRPLTPGEPSVCVRFYDEAGDEESNGADACPPAQPAGGTQGPRVEVTVTRPSRLDFGMGSVGPITLRGSAVARYEPSLEEPG